PAWASASLVRCRALPRGFLRSCTRCCSAPTPGPVRDGRSFLGWLYRVSRVKSFPLIVLSRAPGDLDWDRKQTDLLRLSSNSQQLFADRSGHNIQLDGPEAAAAEGAPIAMSLP